MRTGRINLLPVDLRPNPFEMFRWVPIGILVLICLNVIISAVQIELEISRKKAFHAKLNHENEVLKKRIDDLTRLQEGLKVEEAKIAQLQTLIDRKFRWSEPFKELSGLIPKHVWLEEMVSRIDKGSRAITLVGAANSHHTVAEFFKRLEESYYFRNVRIKFSAKNEEMNPTLYQFEFEVPLVFEGRGA